MDRGAWWATVHRVTKSQTRLSNKHIFFLNYFKPTVETYCSENKILFQLLLADRYLLTQEL